MGIEDIYWITPEFSVIVAGVVGLLVGSFLNVVIHRLPLMMQAQWEAELEEALAQQNTAAAMPVTPKPRCQTLAAASTPVSSSTSG